MTVHNKFGRYGWQLWRRVLLTIVLAYTGIRLIQTWRHTRPLNDHAWENVQHTGILRVGMDASFPPFAAIQGDQIVGLDAELASVIGERLGVKTQLVLVGYDGLYDALLTGQVDILISALPFDPMRYGTFVYTTPYLDAGQYLVTLDKHFTEMNALDGQRIAVEYGGMGDETARVWERRLHTLTILRYASAEEALDSVINGKANAALVDYVSARMYQHHAPQLIISMDSVAAEAYLIVARRTSLDLAGKVQAVLNELIDDGTLTTIINHWL